jgi:hypothetical protein
MARKIIHKAHTNLIKIWSLIVKKLAKVAKKSKIVSKICNVLKNISRSYLLVAKNKLNEKKINTENPIKATK